MAVPTKNERQRERADSSRAAKRSRALSLGSSSLPFVFWQPYGRKSEIQSLARDVRLMPRKREPKTTPPQQSKADAAHAVTKGALSSIPVAGGAASELFNWIVQPPIEKRLDRWRKDIAESLQRLEQIVDGFSLEQLRENESFITTVQQTTRLALATHQQEKLTALRNVVLNVAVDRTPADDVQQILLNHIDSLTVTHIRVLQVFRDVNDYVTKHNITLPTFTAGAPSHVLENCIPDLRGQRNLYDQLVRDLHSRGLFTLDSLHVMMTGRGMTEKRTTGLGDALLDLISSPIEEGDIS